MWGAQRRSAVLSFLLGLGWNLSQLVGVLVLEETLAVNLPSEPPCVENSGEGEALQPRHGRI